MSIAQYIKTAPIFGAVFSININLSDWKTLGRCPNTPRFFEKNRVKLLSKRNYIAFFGTKLKFIGLKDLGVSPQTLKIFWKKFSKTFGKMQFHCIFCKSICDIFKVFPLVGKMSRKWQMRGKQRKSFNQSFNITY